MFQLSPVFLEVSDHREYVDDEESGDGSDGAQDAADLRVEDRNQGGNDENHDVDAVENLVSDLLVPEKQLEAKRAQEVVDKGEAAEEESEKGETHYEGEGVGDREHVHAVLLHLGLFEVDVVLEEVLAHEADGAHQPHRHIGEADEEIAKEHISLVIFLHGVVSHDGQGDRVEEVPDAEGACQGAEVRVEQLDVAMLRRVSRRHTWHRLTGW